MTAAVEIDAVSKVFRLGASGATSVKDRVLGRERDRTTTFRALDDVTLTIEQGQTFGLLGHNGSGKSTLLKCIARTLTPTSGSIRTRGSIAALLELGAGFHPDLTGRENIELNAAILGISPKGIRRRMEAILAFAEVEAFADTPLKHYSSGMFARLGFAVAMFLEPDILLVDEVLSVGDEAFQHKCLGEVRRLQREGRTIVVVTHSADMIREFCHQAAVLDHGRLITVGDPPDAIRAMRDTYLARSVAVPDDLTAPQNLQQADLARFGDIDVRFPDPGRQWIHPGEPIEIVAAIDVPAPTDDLVVSVALYDAQGRRLLGANSDREGSPPGERAGRIVVGITLERLPLLGGTYHLDLGLHNRDGSVSYDHREKICSFTVENRSGLTGLVQVPVSITWSNV